MNDKSKDDQENGDQTDASQTDASQKVESVEATADQIEDGDWQDVKTDDASASDELNESRSDDRASSDDTETVGAVEGSAATTAALGATAAAQTHEEDEQEEEEKGRGAPVVAYVWLAILTLGVIYLIYNDMMRGEAVEIATNQAVAAESSVTAMQAAVNAASAKADANAAEITELAELKALPAAIAAQRTQLSELEAALADAKAAVEAVANAAPATGGGASTEAMAAAQAAFEAAQAESTAKLDELSDAIAALGERLKPIEARAAKAASFSLSAAILALDDLRDAIAVGKPFDKLLERAQSALPQDETLTGAEWTEFAASGLPTEDGLREDMQNISIAIGQDKLKDRLNSGESWLDKAVGGVVGRLKVRRVGAAVEGDEPAAIAARAEAAMADGNLAGAIDEVESVQGDGVERFAGWLKAAKALSAARADINEIEEAAIAAADGT